ncbi:MAG TPA: hypothetical protein VII42_15720 [Caulobacteraceae bacterium]
MTTTAHKTMSLRRRTVLATALAAVCLGGAACAHADPVDLTVVDRATGQPLRVWRHDGRLFVAGRPGARYSLRVSNHTDGRVLVVMSVDGVNILSGETANYDQRGYVFGPHEAYDISGWRKSDTEVAAFNFARLPQSYAARTGRPADVGVIGIAVFNERVEAPVEAAPEPYPDAPDESERESSRAADAAAGRNSMAPAVVVPTPQQVPPPPPPPSALMAPSDRAEGPAQPPATVMAQRRDEKLGTAHGAREYSAITIVPFERATSYPQFVRQIEYDTYDNLVVAGVIPPGWSPGHRPQPFPSNSDGAGYVPDPPG